MSELKPRPCPICGAELKIYGPEDWEPSFYDPDSGGDPYEANCDCGFSFSTGTYDYAEFVAALNRRAQLANVPLIDVCAMLEQAAQDMDDKCRQWQCVLQRVHDAGTFDQNSGLWVGVDKEREAKAQASFEAYRYALGVIDKIAEHVSNPYKFAHKPGGEQE